MTKMHLQTAVVIAFLFLLEPTAALADSVTSIQPASTGVSVGQNFTVNVDITDVTDLYAFQFDIGFNPAILSANGITEGAFLPSGGPTFFIPGTIDNSAGTISSNADTLLGPGPGVSGNGVLATIDFTAIGSGVSSVTPSNLILLDSTGANINTSAVDGTVTVSGASPVPEPSTSLLLVIAIFLIAFLAAKKPACPLPVR